MELRHLRYFIAVAEELHMGRAAQRLHISQPPLSQQIAALEAEIGTQLFIRRGRGIHLSAAGSAFLEHARSTLAMSEQAVQVAREVGRGETGHLSVAYVSSLAYTYLPHILKQFQLEYPAVQLELREMSVVDQVRALQERSLQVGVLRGPLDNQGIDLNELISEPFVLALPVQHRLAAHTVLPIAALREEAFIVHLRGVFYAPLLELCRQVGFEPKVVQEVTQIHAAVGLVGAGVGVALVPASARALRMEGVTFREIDNTTITTSILAATPAGDTSPLTRNFYTVAMRAVKEASKSLLYGAAEPREEVCV